MILTLFSVNSASPLNQRAGVKVKKRKEFANGLRAEENENNTSQNDHLDTMKSGLRSVKIFILVILLHIFNIISPFSPVLRL